VLVLLSARRQPRRARQLFTRRGCVLSKGVKMMGGSIELNTVSQRRWKV